jgi:hypothetical protein
MLWYPRPQTHRSYSSHASLSVPSSGNSHHKQVIVENKSIENSEMNVNVNLHWVRWSQRSRVSDPMRFPARLCIASERAKVCQLSKKYKKTANLIRFQKKKGIRAKLFFLCRRFCRSHMLPKARIGSNHQMDSQVGLTSTIARLFKLWLLELLLLMIIRRALRIQ